MIVPNAAAATAAATAAETVAALIRVLYTQEYGKRLWIVPSTLHKKLYSIIVSVPNRLLDLELEKNPWAYDKGWPQTL
jgi:hypothetical protein